MDTGYGTGQQRTILEIQMSEQRRTASWDHHSSNANQRMLPPIREVFADELDLPPRQSPYSLGDVHRALPPPIGSRSHDQWSHPMDYGRDEQRGPYSLAPIQQHQSYSSTRRHSTSSQEPPSSVPRDSRSGRYNTQRDQDPAYSYGVLRTSGASGALVNATPPSERPQGILRQTAAPAREDHEDPNKRYKCDYCGKRFGMPSHLDIHLRTHTAQRPFACEWPNCDRTFSVRSNMMRHFRSHGNPTQQGLERSRNDDDEDPLDAEESSSSRNARGSSSHNYSSSSDYYSSFRRK